MEDMIMKEAQMYKMMGTTRKKPKDLMGEKMSKIAHGSYSDATMMANQGASAFLGAPSETMPHNNPFESVKQRKYMFAKHPKIAKKWANEK